MRCKYAIYRLLFQCFPLRKPSVVGLPQSILFVPFDALGDMLIATPIFRAIKHSWPEIKIGVLATPRNIELLHDNPYIDSLYISKGKNYLFDKPERQMIRDIRQEKYDIIVDLWDRVSFLILLRLRLMRPRILLGLRKPPEVEQAKNFKTEQLGLYSQVIEADFSNFRNYMLSTLNYFGLSTDRVRGDIFVSIQNQKTAQNFLATYPDKQWILINIFGSRANNTLSLVQFSSILKALTVDPATMVLLSSGGTLENQTILTHYLAENKQDNVVVVPYQLSILDLTALMCHCELIISTNTAVMHCAEAIDKPLILIERSEMQEQHRKFPLLKHPERRLFIDAENFSINLQKTIVNCRKS